MTLRVVLIGATGILGAMIARRLAGDTRFTLILAVRRPEPLQALCDSLGDATVQNSLHRCHRDPPGRLVGGVATAMGHPHRRSVPVA